MTSQERTVLECCAPWDHVDPARRAQWDWQVLHQLAHGRVPFTVAYFAEQARVDVARAEYLIGEGRVLKWIWQPGPGLFTGLLTKRR